MLMPVTCPITIKLPEIASDVIVNGVASIVDCTARAQITALSQHPTGGAFFGSPLRMRMRTDLPES